jgi:hypothetical protein
MNDDRTPTGRLDEAIHDGPGGTAVPLRRMHNFRITEGDPDVRGWEVRGADGRRIGEVDDLLVDSQALRVRYLDVILDSRLLAGPAETAAEAPGAVPGPEAGGVPGYLPSATATMGGLAPMLSETLVRATLSPEENAFSGGEPFPTVRHVLLPVEQVRMEAGQRRVLVEGLPSSQAAGLPIYDGGEVPAGSETSLATDPRAAAETARMAGLEPGAASARRPVHEVTGELDRAVEEPDHAEVPVRGR